ncbi:MAG TPA: tyrosine--tRNA ligase, partial [Firmicutes bacterium]|nr:tyrosine--tRNA ligase [Bacillota bacterium]
MDTEFDPKALSIDGQLDWLFEGTYFADEGSADVERQIADMSREFARLHNRMVSGEATSEEQTERHLLGEAIDQLKKQLEDQGKSLGSAAVSATSGLRAQMREELKRKLEKSAASGVPLRIYIGVDPTRTSLHIGHMVPVVQLRKFQALGHTVIFLIGDYTATVGDPSGQSSEREALSHERVLELAEFYQDQAFRLLDREQTEIRYNGEWLSRLSFNETAELAAQFPLGQVIARQDFRNRLESGAGVRLHECLYMLMQGYDAYALNCDVQVGGYDQHFNLLAGRILQKHFAEKLKGKGDHPLYPGQPVKGPHVMMTYPLLMGTDGRKMSKSWGNTIDVLDEPHDIYGKVMRIADEMIPHYIDIAVEARQALKEQWKQKAADDPMGVKKWVAHSITALFCGDEAAQAAAEHFQRTVQDKQVGEEDAPEAIVPQEFQYANVRLADLIVALALAPSKKEAQRLMEQG